jgi:malic enzyme
MRTCTIVTRPTTATKNEGIEETLTVVSDGTRLLEVEAVGTLKGGEVAEGELLEELGGLPSAVLHGEVGVGLDLETGEGRDSEGAAEARVAFGTG